MTGKIFYASDQNYLMHSLECLSNFDRLGDDLEQINNTLDLLYNNYKEILALELPRQALDVIDDFKNNDIGEELEWWFKMYNPRLKSLIQAIGTILWDIQSIKIIVTELIFRVGIDGIWRDYCNYVYRLEDHIKIAHELIKKRLDRRDKGHKVGSNPTELKGIMKAIVEYIQELETRGINGSVKRHEVVISFAELIWHHFERYTSGAPYCLDKYEIYVDNEKICQEDNKSIRKRSKKTFMNYVSKAKKLLNQ